MGSGSPDGLDLVERSELAGQLPDAAASVELCRHGAAPTISAVVSPMTSRVEGRLSRRAAGETCRAPEDRRIPMPQPKQPVTDDSIQVLTEGRKVLYGGKKS